MGSKLGWGITIWLGLALVATCFCARTQSCIPVIVPVLVGLGAPAIVLLWQHRQHLHRLLSGKR